MSDGFVKVQRNTPGAAVWTRSNATKQPVLLTDNEDLRVVDESELVTLLAARVPFDSVAVPRELAERILGWTIASDEGVSST